MQEINVFNIFVSRFNSLGVTYMVTGAVASVTYGEPRFTNDMDLVLDMGGVSSEDLIDAFPSSEFYCPPAEIINEEMRRTKRGHFNIIHQETGFKADVYLIGNEKIHKWAMGRRRRIIMESEPFWLAPPEYVILRKLEYYKEGGSEKHLRDIRGILQLSADQLDMEEIERWIEEYGLESEWKAAKETIE
jgi:hypothetical protein